MTAWMLRDKHSGKFYCKGSQGYKRRNPAIWPTWHGAAAAIGHMAEYEKARWEYVEFDLVEKVPLSEG